MSNNQDFRPSKTLPSNGRDEGNLNSWPVLRKGKEEYTTGVSHAVPNQMKHIFRVPVLFPQIGSFFFSKHSTCDETPCILFHCSHRDNTQTESCSFHASHNVPIFTSPAGNLISKSVEIFHQFFLPNCSISISELRSVTQKNDQTFRDWETS